MRFGGLEFKRASDVTAKVDAAGSLILETPHTRFKNPKNLQLNAYGRGPFVRLHTESSLPAAPGLYALVDDGDKVLYVGRARDSIAGRWGRSGYAVIDPRNCYKGGQSTNCRINSLIRGQLLAGGGLALWTHLVDDPVEPELRVIGAIRPPWNLRT